MSDLAEKIARDIFEAGDEHNNPTTRIQFMSKDWHDGTEKGQGGFCEDALAQCIRASLSDFFEVEPL